MFWRRRQLLLSLVSDSPAQWSGRPSWPLGDRELHDELLAVVCAPFHLRLLLAFRQATTETCQLVGFCGCITSFFSPCGACLVLTSSSARSLRTKPIMILSASAQESRRVLPNLAPKRTLSRTLSPSSVSSRFTLLCDEAMASFTLFPPLLKEVQGEGHDEEND